MAWKQIHPKKALDFLSDAPFILLALLVFSW